MASKKKPTHKEAPLTQYQEGGVNVEAARGGGLRRNVPLMVNVTRRFKVKLASILKRRALYGVSLSKFVRHAICLALKADGEDVTEMLADL